MLKDVSKSIYIQADRLYKLYADISTRFILFEMPAAKDGAGRKTSMERTNL